MKNIILIFVLLFSVNSFGGVVIPDGPFANTGGYKVRATGITGTAAAGVNTNIEYKLTENRKINGVDLLLSGQHFDDVLCFQVVDKDGVYYPAGTILDEFGTDWNVNSSAEDQGQIIFPYAAMLLQNLYIRIVYKSKGTVAVKVKANLFLHKAP
jgi:hypothetical protein